jgi:hypothetical protein
MGLIVLALAAVWYDAKNTSKAPKLDAPAQAAAVK